MTCLENASLVGRGEAGGLRDQAGARLGREGLESQADGQGGHSGGCWRLDLKEPPSAGASAHMPNGSPWLASWDTEPGSTLLLSSPPALTLTFPGLSLGSPLPRFKQEQKPSSQLSPSHEISLHRQWVASAQRITVISRVSRSFLETFESIRWTWFMHSPGCQLDIGALHKAWCREGAYKVWGLRVDWQWEGQVS